MNEKFLQYIWKYQLWDHKESRVWGAKTINVLHPGIQNQNSGPDFENAKVQINGYTWVGNIEIHINSSSWISHKHHLDQSYNNVILHVVNQFDKPIFNQKTIEIPTLEIIIPESLYSKYNQLVNSQEWISCENYLTDVDRITINKVIESNGIERIIDKFMSFSNYLKDNENDFEKSMIIAIAKAFGGKVNSIPFEILGQKLNNKLIASSKKSIVETESLVFGLAGFPGVQDHQDSYLLQLKEIFSYYQHKFDLHPVEYQLWKFFRIRPIAYPTIRLAQFAGLLYYRDHFISNLSELKKYDDFVDFFNVPVTDYWKNHYLFGKETRMLSKAISNDFLNLIIINALIPMFFGLGKHTGNEVLIEHSVNLLASLPPESNKIIDGWANRSITAKNAFESQALLNLKSNYCDQKKCLDCSIGRFVIN